MFENKTIISPADGLEISVMACRPENSPKAIIQLVHGMCEHKERYMPLMEYLASHGYLTIIHDHRGHGKSIREAGDLGYFYSGGYLAMIEDIKAVQTIVKSEHPGLPLLLLGHSMGSMAVRAFAKRYDAGLDALIVCGSPSYNPAAGIGKAIARLYSLIAGAKYRPKIVQKLSFGAFNHDFPHAASPNSWVCSDPAIVQAYDNDPFCNFQFTANGFENLFSLMQDAYDMPRGSAGKPQLPVLFISGAEDPCLTNHARFEAAVNRMRTAGYKDVSSKLYPGMRHEILNETRKAEVWSDVLSFADAHLKAE